MNTADILDKAADLIDTYGHCKGVYFGDDGSMCMYGSVVLAGQPGYDTENPADLTPEVMAAHRCLDRFMLRQRQSAPAFGWNDAPERTKEEVVSTLRAAAQAARAEQ